LRVEHPVVPDSDILQTELQKKLSENESLHKKISDMEIKHTQVVSGLTDRCRELEDMTEELKEEIKRMKLDASTSHSP
uniref:ELKS/RAB6-interacting/CAST family member 2 n=1 Tax=Gongylonema pulchrum TaxID=637853 RepID=A0A183EYJ8_9BILA